MSILQCDAPVSDTEGPRPSGRAAPGASNTLLQRLLMQFAGTLSRRRAYAASHPMVLSAEAQLMALCTDVLAGRLTLVIGIAKSELLIDGQPYETRASYARELSVRLHRRGVGSLTFDHGLRIEDLRAALTWLAREAVGSDDVAPDGGSVHITRTAYDHLVLDEAIRDAEAAVASLWRTLAELAEFGLELVRDEEHRAPHGAMSSRAGAVAGVVEIAGYDTTAIVRTLQESLHHPAIARRTAAALMELTTCGASAHPDGRVLIGQQLQVMLRHLGASSMAPILQSLTDRSVQQRFVSEVVDVLPVAAIVDWLHTAAAASEQQLSHHMLRLMTKLSTLAGTRGTEDIELTFRGAAHDLVNGWSLVDPNPEHHVMLLDRIANFERAAGSRFSDDVASASSIVESTRVVQMALELDFGGEDTVAAVEALIAASEGRQVMRWLAEAGESETARWLRRVATSDKAVRQLLLTEPVDRLEARALLEAVGPSSADTLLDVMAASSTRGTRLLVRQRLAEFGTAITPQLLARLDTAHWFLLRNILTLLHDSTARNIGDGAVHDAVVRLLEHPQVQVRVEALRVLLLADATTRDTAIRRALRDENERVVVLALQTLADAGGRGLWVPMHIVTQLMTMVDAGALSDPVRARAVRTLAFAPPAAVRDWLIRLITRRTRFLRRLSLAEPTRTAVSALHVLTRFGGDDPAAAATIALARRALSDPRWQLRDAGSSEERAT